MKHLTILLCLISFVTPTFAHKLVATVYSVGNHIEGEIGYSNGDMVDKAVVEIFTPDEQKLGQARTNDEGFFTFDPKQSVDHIFRVDLGSGHVAQVVLNREELPQFFKPSVSSNATNVALTEKVASTAQMFTEAQFIAISSALSHELKPLKKEIIALKEKNSFQSIIGGIGYIFGLFGLGFYLLARRRIEKD